MRTLPIFFAALVALVLMGFGLKFFPFPDPVQPLYAADIATVEIAKLNAAAPKFPRKPLLPADVMVIFNDTGGHGSGVSIGSGFYVTAAHVALPKSKRLDLKFHDGSIRKAELLWRSEEYDLALMRASGEGVEGANLLCADIAPGTPIAVKGSPFFIEFSETFGKIAGKPLTLENMPKEMGRMKSAQVIDLTVLPGNSGGPVFDMRGNLVGIVVAVINAPGFGLTPTGLGVMVPSKTVCQLLARS